MVRSRNVVRLGDTKNSYKILVGRRKWKRPLGKPRRRCNDNIKIYPKELVCDGVDTGFMWLKIVSISGLL